MVKRGIRTMTWVGLMLPVLGFGQQPCTNGIRIDGLITDPTGAVIPGAKVQTSNGMSTVTDTTGHYLLACIPATSTTLTAQADGFARGTASARARQGGSAHVNLQLAVASVETDVQVRADASGIDSDSGAGTTVLNTQQVQQLPDDPDDLLRQLQIMASSGGGDPTATTIGVDGFQNSSALPPKSSIASIRINGGVWGLLRTRNINAPMVATSMGTAPDPTAALMSPRPIAPNENILQYENGGHFSGPLSGIGLSQNSFKRFGFSASYKYEDAKSDGGDNDGTTITSPQSSYSSRGEASRVDWNHWSTFTFSGHALLPYKLELAAILDARNGSRYNIVTGTDNNGDGIFNDRPSFASAPGAGVYPTRFGLLTTNTVNGTVPRNLGILPGKIHLDMNVSRAFSLNPNNKDHPRTLTFNTRNANLLNHTNVTAVNNVLFSSLGQPLTAETARRLELGVRFAF